MTPERRANLFLCFFLFLAALAVSALPYMLFGALPPFLVLVFSALSALCCTFFIWVLGWSCDVRIFPVYPLPRFTTYVRGSSAMLETSVAYCALLVSIAIPAVVIGLSLFFSPFSDVVLAFWTLTWIVSPFAVLLVVGYLAFDRVGTFVRLRNGAYEFRSIYATAYEEEEGTPVAPLPRKGIRVAIVSKPTQIGWAADACDNAVYRGPIHGLAGLTVEFLGANEDREFLFRPVCFEGLRAIKFYTQVAIDHRDLEESELRESLRDVRASLGELTRQQGNMCDPYAGAVRASLGELTRQSRQQQGSVRDLYQGAVTGWLTGQGQTRLYAGGTTTVTGYLQSASGTPFNAVAATARREHR